jgi:hypothetical protein
MTTAIAAQYIPSRMAELGIKDYIMRFHYLFIPGGQTIVINAYNEFYFIVEDPWDINISSASGVYDKSLTNVNNQQYEHQGEISIKNYLDMQSTLHCIQVIPKHTKKEN